MIENLDEQTQKELLARAKSNEQQMKEIGDELSNLEKRLREQATKATTRSD